MLDVLPRVVLRLLAINVVQAFGLEEFVDLRTSDTDEEFLGELVGDGLACIHIHPSVCCVFAEDECGSEVEGEAERWGTNLPCADDPQRS